MNHTDIIITMPCSDCGENFSAMFDPEAGNWKPFNTFDEPDASCRCLLRAADQFDITRADVSYIRLAEASQRRSEQVRETLADTMRIAFARSVPAGQMELETAT